MPELTIKSLPTPSAAGPGTANALNPADAASPAGDHGKPITDGGVASSFAEVLQSQVGRQLAAAVAEGELTATGTLTDIENIDKVFDLSAIFPLLGPPLDEKAVSPTGAEEGPPETGTATYENLPTPLQPPLPEAPVSILATPFAAAAPILDANSGKQPPGTPSQPTAAMGASPEIARASVTNGAPGKGVPDPAITAGASQNAAEGRTSEPSGKEFRAVTEIAASDLNALMERTANMGPIGTNRTGGSPQTTALRVETPMGQPQWHDEVGQKLTWMVGNNRQQADLVLTPPQLGRIEVSLTMNGDQASAIFTSPNPAVREALEGSLQRLREVLADAGVSLGQTQVGSESPNQSGRREDRDAVANNGLRYAGATTLPGSRALADASAGRGMIDIFA